jgi:hypothetical protein
LIPSNRRDPTSQTSTRIAVAEQPTWHCASAASVPSGAISISPLINCCQCKGRCKFPSQKIHLQRRSAISLVTKEKVNDSGQEIEEATAESSEKIAVIEQLLREVH